MDEALASGRKSKGWRLAFHLSFYEGEVIDMSDFEILSIVIMIMMLVVSVAGLYKNNNHK